MAVVILHTIEANDKSKSIKIVCCASNVWMEMFFFLAVFNDASHYLYSPCHDPFSNDRTKVVTITLIITTTIY